MRGCYAGSMAWEVEYTDQFRDWFEELDEAAQAAVSKAVEELQRGGPALGRPFVDTIKRSRHANMKELRPPEGHLRVLFAFDPLRTAILLIGGDKTGRWRTWYDTMIPLADRLYDEHLIFLRKEELLP
jgi:hypothetical protein